MSPGPQPCHGCFAALVSAAPLSIVGKHLRAPAVRLPPYRTYLIDLFSCLVTILPLLRGFVEMFCLALILSDIGGRAAQNTLSCQPGVPAQACQPVKAHLTKQVRFDRITNSFCLQRRPFGTTFCIIVENQGVDILDSICFFRFSSNTSWGTLCSS